MTKIPVRHKRPIRAMPRQHYATDLLRRYLSVYAADPDFSKRLRGLAREYADVRQEMFPLLFWEVSIDLDNESAYRMAYQHEWRVVCGEAEYGNTPVIKDYVRDVKSLAVAVGLDTLPMEQGYEAIHSWFCYWLRKDNHSPQSFGRYVFHEMASLDPPKGARLTANRLEIAIEVRLSGGWKYFSEAPGEAKARLAAEAKHIIEREIDRHADAMAQGGYVFPQNREEEVRHLHWLFRRVKERMSCDAIAGQEARDGRVYSSEYIQKATKELSSEIGMEIPRPYQQR